MDMAVTKFQSLHIFRGYSDGSLWENNSITRGELALVLDRYDTYKNTLKEATTCTGDIHPWVAIILQDQFGKSITRAVITADKWITDGWLDKDYKTIDVLTNWEYRFLDEEDWEFLITISKNGYSQYKETLNISRNHCHVNTQYRTVTLIKL